MSDPGSRSFPYTGAIRPVQQHTCELSGTSSDRTTHGTPDYMSNRGSEAVCPISLVSLEHETGAMQPRNPIELHDHTSVI